MTNLDNTFATAKEVYIKALALHEAADATIDEVGSLSSESDAWDEWDASLETLQHARKHLLMTSKALVMSMHEVPEQVLSLFDRFEAGNLPLKWEEKLAQTAMRLELPIAK